MELVCSSGTLVPAYKTGLCFNPEDHNMIIHRPEDWNLVWRFMQHIFIDDILYGDSCSISLLMTSCMEIYAAYLYRWHLVWRFMQHIFIDDILYGDSCSISLLMTSCMEIHAAYLYRWHLVWRFMQHIFIDDIPLWYINSRAWLPCHWSERQSAYSTMS
jgi:hypothetical protein